LTNLIKQASFYRPPPSSYLVKGSGLDWINGTFTYANETNPDGSALYIAEAPKYTMTAKNGKVLTLFRCQMRSNQKWWFISEADPEQPGTDKDIDYYQHKSSKYEEKVSRENLK
jgi:ubiquitin carboxyl-terminal hydrolase 9/24